MHLLYAVVLVVGFMWAECREGHVYPVSFLLSDGLFLICYGMLVYVKKRGFDINDLNKDNDGGSNDSGEEDDGATQEDIELFQAQISVFFAQQRLLAIWHIMEMILGYVLFNHFFEEAITCDDNNDAWVFNYKAGKVFFMLHTFGVKQSLGVASKVFFKTVRKVDKRQQRKEKGKKKKDE